MTQASTIDSKPGSLPPLSGGLLAVYTIVWGPCCSRNCARGHCACRAERARGHPRPAHPKSAILIAVSAILLWRRRRDPVAAMLSVAFLLWTISSSVDFTATAASSWAAVLDRFRFLFFALALILFPNGEWKPAWARHVAAATFAVFLIGLAEALAILPHPCLPAAGDRLRAWRHADAVPAISRKPITRRAPAAEMGRARARRGIGLILIARAGAALTDHGLLSGMTQFLLETLFQSGIITIALGFLVSLLRFRLYDAEAAISRSAAFAGLTLALVGTFAASEALIQNFGQNYFGAGVGNASGAIAAAIAAVLLTPLHSRISAWAEQHFQRDLAVLKQQLPELLADLGGTASASQIGDAVLPLIDQAIHAARAALLIDGTLVAVYGVNLGKARSWAAHRQLAADGLFSKDARDHQFPVRMALRCPLGTIRGWLLLGPRPTAAFTAKTNSKHSPRSPRRSVARCSHHGIESKSRRGMPDSATPRPSRSSSCQHALKCSKPGLNARLEFARLRWLEPALPKPSSATTELMVTPTGLEPVFSP